MKIVSERREIVGTLKTLVGTYHLLDRQILPGPHADMLRANILDDEGFDTWAIFRGDFIVLSVSVPVHLDVKRVLTEVEAKDYNLAVVE